MISDTLKVSLIKLAVVHRSSSFAPAAVRVYLQLLIPPRQYFFFKHFEMYLPCTDIYLAHANTGESPVENSWMLNIQYVVLGLRGDMKKTLKY